MNWGYKILFVYIIFVAGIILLVVKSSGLKEALVTEDYYEQELVYQEKIDESERASSLSSPLTYAFDATQVKISFPKEMIGQLIEANVMMYCAADATRDRKIKTETRNGIIPFSLSGLKKGMYELKISWEVNKVKYYSTQKFIKP